MNKKHLIYFALILSVLIGGSCKTRKIIKEPIKEKDEGAEYLFSQLKKNELKFDWISAKLSADLLIDKKSSSLNAHLRIKKDSLIWASFSPALGIEIARVLITTDSVKLLNRLNKTYFIGDFKLINQLLNTNLDFDILQSIIIGNDFSYYENDVFKANVFNKLYHLSTFGRKKLKKHVKNEQEELRVLVQDIWLDPENYKIKKIMIKLIQKENRKLEVFYSDFQKINEQLFPFQSNIVITSEKMMNISIKYSKIVFDVPQGFPFKIPKKYTKLK